MTRLLRRLVLRFYLRRPVIWVVTFGGVAMGVAAIVAIDIATTSSATAMRLSLAALYGDSTHQIAGGPDGIPFDTYAKLRREHPHLAVAPVIAGRGRLAGKRIDILGLDIIAEPAVRPGLVRAISETDNRASGNATALLTAATAIALAKTTSDELGATVGDELGLVTASGTVDVRLAMTLADAPAGVVFTDIGNAARWLGRGSQLTRVDINADSAPREFDRLRNALPVGLTLVATQARSDSTVGMTRAFSTNLTAMSLLAMLIGVFLIFNAISFAVVQRREQFAALRAFGVERKTILTLVLTEAGAIGLLGTLAGIGFGYLLGTELTALVARTINDLYFRVNVVNVSLTGATVAKALLLGLPFTVLAAVPAALEAAATVPSLALRRSTIERRSMNVLGWLVAGGVLFALAAGVVLVATRTSLVAGLTALFLLVFAYAMVQPAVVIGLLDGVLRPFARRLGRTSALAVGGIRSGFSRTGVAIVALTIAIAATVGVSAMVSSFRGSVEQWLDQSFQADYFVAGLDGAIDDSLRQKVRALPGVAAVGATRRAWVTTSDGPVRLQAIVRGDVAGTQQLVAAVERPWPRFEAGEGVIVAEPFAFGRGISPGDMVRLPTGDGEAALPVLAIYRSYDATGGAVLLALSRYREMFADQRLDALALRLDADADRAATTTALNTVLEESADFVVTDARTIKTATLAIFDQTFLITDVLYLLAVAIAVVGIVGASLAVQIEQQSTFATFRTLGMTRFETARLVLVQAALSGLIAGVFAIPLGFGMARVLIDVVNRRAFGWTMSFEPDLAVVINALAIAVIAALAGALLPAWRAARTGPAALMRGAG